MLLRNKKTGEVVKAYKRGPIDLYFYSNEHEEKDMIDRKTYQSLSELNEEWEDYAPKEPLIKDEKIRKALRAWANANGVERVLYMENIYRFSAIDIATSLVVDFGSMIEHSNLEGGFYTIDELCGEEEND